MDDQRFREFLECEGLTDKAINSRITRANRVEREFNVNLNIVVQNEKSMIELRQKIYEKYLGKGSMPGNLYNAVTKYYKYKNGIEMIRISQTQFI